MGGINCKCSSPDGSNPRKVRGKSSRKNVRTDDSESEDYIEGVVCNENDVKENEMKLFPLGEDGEKVLVVKQDGELHAIGTKCSHYGALLTTGALGKGRVRCPWHGACFNIKNGDIEDFPGLDAIPCYKLSVNRKGEVKVRAKRRELESNKRTKDMVAYKADNAKTVVIVGGGPSGATCAETLRQEGFTGRIVMVCKENALPYDRPKVSKSMSSTVDKMILRSQSFYDEHNIQTLLGTAAIGLDTNLKTIELSNHEDLAYDYLYIATGSRARYPNVPGADLKNIFVVYDHTDSAAIISQLSPEKHVVCLGFGFVGMEAAAYCIGKCASVTVIGRRSAPFIPIFGEEIGVRIKQDFEQKGVKIITGNNIARFLPTEDGESVHQVVLLDETILQCDIAIMGVGASYNTEWLKDTQLEILKDGSIVTDKFLKTNVENIYAGGDIAFAPVYSSGDKPATITHYPLAHYHGKIAALNICGKKTPLKSVPFFWTMLFGKSYRYAGHGESDGMKIVGSLEDFKFIAYYFKDGKVIAMSSVGRDPIVADFANLLYEGRELTQEEVEKDPLAWIPNKPKDLLETLSVPDITTAL